MSMKLSIIIPAYNEEPTIKQLIDRVESVAYQVEHEIVIIDDGSQDKTWQSIVPEQASKRHFRLFQNCKNIGKGACVRQGISYASGDIIIIQDADLEYDPNDYIELIKPILNKKAKVVYGSRLLKPDHKYPFSANLVATKLLSLLTNILYNTNITDEPTCYKVFKADVLKSINLKCERFEFCPEVTAKVRKKGYKIYELPIHYDPRTAEEGKKINWKDGVEAFWTLFKYRFIN